MAVTKSKQSFLTAQTLVLIVAFQNYFGGVMKYVGKDILLTPLL